MNLPRSCGGCSGHGGLAAYRGRLARERVRAQDSRERREHAGPPGECEGRGRATAVGHDAGRRQPAAPPIAIAVPSQAKASVTAPAGATRSTIAYTEAKAGASAAPATSRTAPSATRLPVAATEREMPGGQSGQHQREPRGTAGASAESSRDHTASERTEPPEPEQGPGGRAAPERGGGRGRPHLDRAAERADGEGRP